MTATKKLFKLPSVAEFINEGKKLRRLNEAEDTQFGDEISKINDWFGKKYDAAFSFDWDGSKLSVMDGDKKETESFTRDQLAKEIDGFPAKSSVTEAIANAALASDMEFTKLGKKVFAALDEFEAYAKKTYPEQKNSLADLQEVTSKFGQLGFTKEE